jgi:chromosome segregation ATPase
VLRGYFPEERRWISLSNIKLKIAIVCAVAVAASAMLYVQQQTVKELRQENESLKQQVAQIAPLQEQLAGAAQAAAGGASVQEGQTRELARLRNEVSQLRKQSNDLVKARQDIQTLHQRVASEAEAGKGALAQAQAENQKLQNFNACVNNLHLLEAAKRQWAQQNGKQPADAPTMEDLRPSFGPNGVAPVCPDGGVYTLGAMSEQPTCSIAGHALK